MDGEGDNQQPIDDGQQEEQFDQQQDMGGQEMGEDDMGGMDGDMGDAG
jgi:hypothetical protein